MASGIVSLTTILPLGIQHAFASAPIVGPVMTQPLLDGVVTGATTAKIITTFQPLLQPLIDLALPVTSIIITGACFLYMINMKDKATSMMINGIIGYFLIQMSLIFMRVIGEITKAM